MSITSVVIEQSLCSGALMEDVMQNYVPRCWGISSHVPHHLFTVFGCIFGSKGRSVLIQIKQGAFGGFASQLKENLKSTQTGALLEQEGEG